MRKIIVLSMISLDGVMQAPGGPEEDTSNGFTKGGWVISYFDEELGELMTKQLASTDLLLGRKTYDIFASYWPTHEHIWPGINDVNKYVLTNTLQELEWNNAHLLRSVDDIRQLKEGNGPDLQVHGSGELVKLLLKHDLVDELWMKIYPITLGSGKKLFGSDGIPAAFELTEGTITKRGVIIANYRRAGDIITGTIGDTL